MTTLLDDTIPEVKEPKDIFPYLKGNNTPVAPRLGLTQEDITEMKGENNELFLNSPYSSVEEAHKYKGCITSWEKDKTISLTFDNDMDKRLLTVLLFNLRRDFNIVIDDVECTFGFREDELLSWELNEEAYNEFGDFAASALTFAPYFKDIDTTTIKLLGTNVPIYIADAKITMTDAFVQETEANGKWYYYAYPTQVKIK